MDNEILKKYIPCAKRRWEEIRRGKGLCYKCGAPKRSQFTKCDKCLAKHRKLVFENTQKWKANNLCINCGKPLTEMDAGFVSHERSNCKPSRRTP